MGRLARRVGCRQAVWIALVVVIAATNAFAAGRAQLDDPFEITADRIDYDGRRQLYVATGRVRVQQVDRSLRADWVAFSTETRIGVAEGAVELVDASDVVQAEFMVFDVDSLRGMFFEGGLDAGTEGFKVRAKEMVRTGKNTFRMTDGTFTTCRCPDGEQPPWEISTGAADVELGDYGTVTNATFDVLGVPVLWVPWAFFPVKSDRETGLLLPRITLGGRSGFGGGIPFFWAAHEQVNLTLTPFYFSERGFKGDAELEYVFGERSEGTFFVSGLRDQRDERFGATRDNRWGVHWDHDQELPFDWRWQTDVNVNSDNFYSDDFPEFRDFRNNRFMESTTNVNRSFGASGGVGVMVGARFADDVQGFEIASQQEFVDTDDVLLQRFGEAALDVQPGAVVMPGGIEARLDADVIHFRSLRDPDDVFGPLGGVESAADGRFYDIGIDAEVGATVAEPPPTTEGDGRFQPGEIPSDRGVRAVIHPRLARPFRIADAVEVVPELGWRQYLYSTEASRFADRGLLTARLDARSRLARDFGWGPGGQGTLRHVVEPGIGWAFVSEMHDNGDPLFVPTGVIEQARLRALSMESLTRNPSDRVARLNRIVLGVGQRFYTRSRGRGSLTLRADVRTAIDWDFEEGGLGALYLDARLFGVGPVSSRIVGAFDPGTEQLDEGGIDLAIRERWKRGLIRSAGVTGGYRYRRRLPTLLESNRGLARVNTTDSVSQIQLRFQTEFSFRIRLMYSTIYKLSGEDEFLRNQGTVEYVSKCRCWAIGASIAFDRRDQLSGGFSIRFMGLGDPERVAFGQGFGTGLNF